jgi:hypothetical protein
MQVSDAIETLVARVYQLAIPFLTAAASVGVLSMALIQTAKDILPLRRWFQRNWIGGWLDGKAKYFVLRAPRPPLKGLEHPEYIERDLIRLATDGDDNAFYDLQIEQLCGQMNAAAQVAIDYAQDYPDLLKTLACMAKLEDIRLLLDPPPAAKQPRSSVADPKSHEEFNAYVDARNRVTHQIQRAIDALQVSAGFRWKWYLQIASIVLSGVIAGIGVWRFGHFQDPWKQFFTTIGAAILGGFLAPVARDLVASLQQLRK